MRKGFTLFGMPVSELTVCRHCCDLSRLSWFVLCVVLGCWRLVRSSLFVWHRGIRERE